MAKRMKFSVVGLPHYTVWHLYEPSVDDIRHMEEMEKERQQKEAEEKAKKAKEDKIRNQFDAKNKDWEKEKAEVQDMQKNEEKEAEKQRKKEKEEQEAKAKAQVLDKKNEANQEDTKEATNQARGFVTPDKIHEAHGSDEEVKPAPRQ